MLRSVSEHYDVRGAKVIQPGTIGTIRRQPNGARLNVALSFFEMPDINIGMHVRRTTEMPHK